MRMPARLMGPVVRVPLSRAIMRRAFLCRQSRSINLSRVKPIHPSKGLFNGAPKKPRTLAAATDKKTSPAPIATAMAKITPIALRSQTMRTFRSINQDCPAPLAARTFRGNALRIVYFRWNFVDIFQKYETICSYRASRAKRAKGLSRTRTG
jgi:hypothetical protein